MSFPGQSYLGPSQRVLLDLEVEKGNSPDSRTPMPKVCGDIERNSLRTKWVESVNNAAPVTFVNDITNESKPPLVTNFQYLEKNYVW